jgi:hypothetical protein
VARVAEARARRVVVAAAARSQAERELDEAVGRIEAETDAEVEGRRSRRAQWLADTEVVARASIEEAARRFAAIVRSGRGPR